ncbi:hypothetical protein Psuf_065690 [Phytohabitans suffuscus]|uniref:Uncharacterized protein n=1 Tax=Phytohabitans suffuscus TaxID=624315 RepID=A0A6F8YT75_9ACTN|nr:hypothetical protein Psuf_065690 [Phytohabitans suffuscus]
MCGVPLIGPPARSGHRMDAGERSGAPVPNGAAVPERASTGMRWVSRAVALEALPRLRSALP